MSDIPTNAKSGGRRTNKRRDWFALAAVAVAVVILGVYLVVRPEGAPDPVAQTPAPGPTSSQAASGSQDAVGTVPATTASENPATVHPQDGQKATPIGPLGDLARREPGDPLAKGEVDAPVVMVMFSDYRCPFCAKFSRTTEPELIDTYVDSGVLRIEWRDLPIFGDQSQEAAMAGRAAAAQDRFWEFTTALYAEAPDTGHPELTTDILIDYARKAAMPDIDAFRAGLDDPAARQSIDEDMAVAGELGVPSTPAFVINGYPLLGAQPLGEFTDLIDKVHGLQE